MLYMKKAKILGAIYGTVGAAAYGTNPLFAKYLLMGGIGVNSMLFYRYFIATVIFAVWLKLVKKVSLKINLKECISLFTVGLLFSLSSITLFKSYQFISIGIASTLLFVYPVIVAVFMAVFFKEKITASVIFSILLTSFGTILLYKGDDGQNLNFTGILLVFISAIMYTLYMIGIKKIPFLKTMNTDKLSFYVIFFGLFVYVYNLKFCTQLQIIHNFPLWLCVVGLAIIPTIISIETTTLGIKLIGSTKTAILGALEPVTALFIGVILFNEPLTPRIICGIISIIFAVIIVIVNQKR